MTIIVSSSYFHYFIYTFIVFILRFVYIIITIKPDDYDYDYKFDYKPFAQIMMVSVISGNIIIIIGRP